MSEYPELPQRYRDGMIRAMNTEAEFWRLLGQELLDFREGYAKVKLSFSKKLTNPTGLAHGGVIFSLADSAAAMAAMGIVKKGELVTTVEMKINYLKPFYRGNIVAEGRITHRGATIALGDVDVRNSEGELIARALATYMIIKKEKGMARPATERNDLNDRQNCD